MRLSRIAALAPLVLLAGPALAQGTAEQRTACMGDAWRLCKSDFTSVDAITACMKRERDKLGQACRAVLEKSERETQQAAAPAPPAERKTAEAPAPAPQTSEPPKVAETPKPAETPAAAQAAPVQPAKPSVAEAPAAATPRTPAVAARKAPERVLAEKPRARVATAARKPVRQVAATRFADDADAREADQWMRRFGLGGLSRETVRDFRRVEAFFDGRL